MPNVPAVVAHGGAGAPSSDADGPRAAVARGLAVLTGGRDALDAAVEATVVLEDDPRFNAGTGSNYRLYGRSIEMDASVMGSDGRSGAVAGVTRIRNPVRLARVVRDHTPHVLVIGAGANRLARRFGFEEFDTGTDRAREKLAKALEEVRGGDPVDDPETRWWQGADLTALWNFDAALSGSLGSTVGAVARDARGGFAVASSTGGTVLMLSGRVGDTPLLGAGFLAGPAGAVACTGTGEEIVKRVLAHRVYLMLEEGVPVQEACERGVALLPEDIGVGIIGVDAEGEAAVSNRDMPSAIRRG
jgi:beta-aspartyl-peptidase (threonine type)